MNGLGIGDITHGYSKVGAEEFKNELNHKAITETAELLRQTNEIKNVFRAGWQGQAEIAFEKNLDNAVEAAAVGLENLKQIMDNEFANIAGSINEFDNNLIVEE